MEHLNLKQKIVIFILLIITGTVLGILGPSNYHRSHGAEIYFWPGAIIQALAGILFGKLGAVAAVIFPIFSNTVNNVGLTKVLVWSVANIPHSFIPLLTKKIFNFNPCEFNKKTILCFTIGCVIIPSVIGAMIGGSALFFSHEIDNARDYLEVSLQWFSGNVSVALIFGVVLLKFFAPALEACKIYVHSNKAEDVDNESLASSQNHK